MTTSWPDVHQPSPVRFLKCQVQLRFKKKKIWWNNFKAKNCGLSQNEQKLFTPDLTQLNPQI